MTRPIALAALALCAAPALAEESGRAASGDLGIYYEVHGDLTPDVTPILLLHGGMGSIDGDFGALLPYLERPVIGVEQQGHAHTGGRDAPVTLASMRADTLAVLDHLGVSRVHAIGFSMGGMLGLDLAVHAPKRLATLTAISVSQNLDGMRPAIADVNRYPDRPPSPEALALMPTEADFAEMQAGFAENPDGPEQFDRTMAALQSFIGSGWGWSDAELAGIEVPTLIVLGDADFTPVAHAAHMAETIGAELAVLPDTTHLTIMRRPDWLAPLVAHRIAD